MTPALTTIYNVTPTDTTPLFRQDAFKKRHWVELVDTTRPDLGKAFAQNLVRDQDFALYELFETLALHDHVIAVKGLIEKAEVTIYGFEITQALLKLKRNKIQITMLIPRNFVHPQVEKSHEDVVKEVKARWKGVHFNEPATLAEGQDPVSLLSLSQDNQDALDVDRVSVTSILFSRYQQYKKKAAEWKRDLDQLSEVLDLVKSCVGSAQFLEPLFIRSAEVQAALPDASKDFARLYAMMGQLLVTMRREGSNSALKASVEPGRSEDLQRYLKLSQSTIVVG